MDRVKEIDPLRNATLAGSETYHAKSAKNAFFDVATKVRKVIDTMPILTIPVAVKLAGRITDKVNQTVASSIWGKIKTQDAMGMDAMIKFCKDQKHDKLFDNLAHIPSLDVR